MTRAKHAELCDMIARLERIVAALQEVNRSWTYDDLIAAKAELERANRIELPKP